MFAVIPRIVRLLPVLALLLFSLSSQAGDSVLVTIRPLAWLVEAIAPPGTDVQVLLDSGRSPHDYQLRPLDISHINRSALLVSVGPGMEPWLQHLGDQLPAARHLQLLPGSLEHHHHNAEDGHVVGGHDDHDEDSLDEDTLDVLTQDPHIWLDPQQMSQAAGLLASRLQVLYPQQAAVIDARLALFRQQMQALDTELGAMFAPVADRGFMVYHDGYGRLAQRYHLAQRGAIWHHEAVPAGARERAAVLQRLGSGDVACLFYEPQFGRDAVAGWLGAAAGKVRLVELDPLGDQVSDGADAYPHFLRAMAAQMVGCLRNGLSVSK